MSKKKTKPVIGISTCMDVGKKINPERTYQYLEISYADAIAEADGIPFIIPYLNDISLYDDVMDGIDGLIISGGEDLQTNIPGEKPEVPLALTPECRLAQDRALLERVLERNIPFVGICYGMQFLNLHFGGTLYYDISHQRPEANNHVPGDKAYRHEITIVEDTLLRTIFGVDKISVNSSHHQAIRDIGTGLKIAATGADDIIEAIEADDGRFILGVQWHPEKIFDENRKHFFSAFINACKSQKK